MNVFENVKFKGTFRDYQKRVIDNFDKFFHDNKINIVAAPGSGKTILGLELIRRLGSNCIILSPTTTIKSQWGGRFEDFFLPENSKSEDYISFDLNNIKPITSITYQSLHSSMSKIKCENEEETIDYSNIDMFKLIKEKNILTICLDEAHHLQNEWQKALEKFIKGLDKNIKIISLTATPPYDASPAEWKRYTDVCGDIDEEIFIPELVKQNNLCPHQDYIYFNFPTENELSEIKNYKKNVEQTISSLSLLEFIKNLQNKINELLKIDDDFIFSNVSEIISVLVLLKHLNFEIEQKLIKSLTPHKTLPDYNVTIAENALNFLAENNKLLSQEESEKLVEIFKANNLIEKNKITLTLTDKLKRKIISSMGKMESIKQIAKFEYDCLKENLHMLILTDFIKKESIKNIGTEKNINSISVVSIFEVLRKELKDVNLAVLSGTLVILPNKIVTDLKKDKKIKFNTQEIQNTNYCLANFNLTNKEKVELIGKLFEEGKIQILIGTKSLLGEGWDSPCINTLVLASFVGSFMLSNQMRGRAIRINKFDKNKTANIWHLVTIEPDELFKESELENKNKNEPSSCDYETLKRRFESFMGPDYETKEIVSGIERIKLIKPPYDEQNIAIINSKMLELASNRDGLAKDWKCSLERNSRTTKALEIPKDKTVPRLPIIFTFAILAVIFTTILAFAIYYINQYLVSHKNLNIVFFVLLLIFLIILTKPLIKSIIRLLSHLSPKKSIHSIANCILKTMKEFGFIDKRSKLIVKNKSKINVNIILKNASVYEQNLFNNSIKEIYSIIDEPRYLLIKQDLFNRYNFSCSFACPTIIGQKKEYAEYLAFRLSIKIAKIKAIYTRNEDGRKLILKCKKKSYITFNQENVEMKHRVVND